LTEPAFIALGSNLEPETHLPLAVRRLTQLGPIRAISMVYQNPAIGPAPAPDFLNAAVLVDTGFSAPEIRGRLRAIEADHGRVRAADKYAPRVIDLDLCLLGSQVRESPELVLPDPDILARPHLAVTLAEIGPDFPHPVTGERLSDIAARLRPGARLRPRPDVASRLPLHPT